MGILTLESCKGFGCHITGSFLQKFYIYGAFGKDCKTSIRHKHPNLAEIDIERRESVQLYMEMAENEQHS